MRATLPSVVIGTEFGDQIVQLLEHPGRRGDQDVAGRFLPVQPLDSGTRLSGYEAGRRVVPEVQASLEIAVEPAAPERAQVERGGSQPVNVSDHRQDPGQDLCLAGPAGRVV